MNRLKLLSRLGVLICTLLLCVTHVWAQSGSCGDNITWTLNNGTLTFSGSGPMPTYSSTNDMTWREYKESVTNIVVEDGITSICRNAFYQFTNVVSITAHTVTNMHDYAISSCSSLSTIDMPNLTEYPSQDGNNLTIKNTPWYTSQADGLVYLGHCLLSYKGTMPSNYNCTTIQNGTTAICQMAFFRQSNLKSVSIPNTVTSIGYSAFSECTGLTSITIPSSVTKIENFAFYQSTNLSTINFQTQSPIILNLAFENTAWLNNQPNGLVYINKVAYKYKGTMPSNTTFTIKDGTTSISPGCFQDCSNLVGINIPNGLTTIGRQAFAYTGVKSITLPASITSCYYALQGMSLTSLTLSEGMTVIPASMCAQGCSSVTSIVIPSTVTSIEDQAFDGAGITSINIPSNVETISTTAFSCNNLASITVAESNSYYSTDANGILYNKNKSVIIKCPAASAITTYTPPVSVNTIESYAFIGCTNLENITIPSSVTSIGASAFNRCSSMEAIVVDEDNEYYSNCNHDGVLYDKNVTKILCFPDAKTVYTIPNTITSFTGREIGSNITTLTIPANVSTLGEYNRLNLRFNNSANILFLYSSEDEIPSTDFSPYNLTVYVPNNLRDTYISKWNVRSSYQSNVVGYNSISIAGDGVTTVTPASNSQTYTGAAITPSVSATLGTATLNLNNNATVTHNFASMEIPSNSYSTSYSNNEDVGTATATITGSGLFSGTAATTFSITPADFADLTTTGSIADQDYEGSALTPAIPTYTLNDNVIAAGSKTYSVGYSNNNAVGQATVTLTPVANGNFTGDAKTLTFNIVRPLGIFFATGRNWATYYAAENLAKPNNMEVYAVTGVSGNAVIIQALDYIPANVGVLLSYDDEGSGFKASAYTGDINDNYIGGLSLLTGSTSGGLTIPSGSYILYNNEFVRATGTSTLAANRCYLPAPSAAARQYLTIGKDGATGIESQMITDDSLSDGDWYSVDGQKINRKPTRKGVYVRDGQKIVIK